MPEAQPKAAAKLIAICPQFVVPDVVLAAEYYRDTFGFRIHAYWGDPPIFTIVSRDGVEIQFGKADAERSVAPNLVRRGCGLDAYIWVDDVVALHEELKQRGAKIIEGPVQQTYGCLELVVDDLNGFRLVFAMHSPYPNA